jgi:hypothetical protein
MMGICSSKQKAVQAKTYLDDNFIHKALDAKASELGGQAQKIISDIATELGNSDEITKVRTELVEANKHKLFDAILQGNPIEGFLDSIIHTNVKLDRLKDLETKLAAIKSQQQVVAEVLAAVKGSPTPSDPQPQVEEKEEALPQPENPIVHLIEPVLDAGVNIVDTIMHELRIHIEEALSNALKKST